VPPRTDVVDLFAGPGGWDVAARRLGLDPLGVEWTEDTCATRRRAGLRTLRVDVSTLDPRELGPAAGLIASPPCQTFTQAGSLRDGLASLPGIRGAMDALARGEDVRHLAAADPRSVLVVEPLRWALALRPEWLAWEQVPRVLPIWRHAADVLGARGYRCWTGVLDAADYGLPQRRQRAVLIGARAGVPGEPAPTHAEGGAGGLAPWVSMAEALGWDPTWKLRSHYRRVPSKDLEAGRNVGRVYSPSDVVAVTRPSRTVTGGTTRWNLRTPRGTRFLSAREVAILQGWPEGYPWPTPDMDCRLNRGPGASLRVRTINQLSVAVPPPLAEAVLREALRAAGWALDNGEGPHAAGPREQLVEAVG
jgi:DNA (cytosine-5)-methyltransferase 1